MKNSSSSRSHERLSPSDWYNRGHDLVEEQWDMNVDNFELPTFRSGFYV
jgi:hypothetical protein